MIEIRHNLNHGIWRHSWKTMKACLVSSHGGHLYQLWLLREAFKGFEVFYITYRGFSGSEIRPLYYLNNIGRNPWRMIVAFAMMLRILIKEKPDVVISTGSEIAVPALFVAKILGIHAIFIESVARILSPSGTGRLVYPIADLFLVQSQKLLEKYGSKARYAGSII